MDRSIDDYILIYKMDYDKLVKLNNSELIKLAETDKNISDDVWYKLLSNRCGGLYKDYISVNEFNILNGDTKYNNYREAFIGAYNTSTKDAIKRKMIDIMWFNFDVKVVKEDDELLIYLSQMPRYTFNRLVSVLDNDRLGSIMAKQYNYDEALEYFEKGSGDIDKLGHNIFFDLSQAVEETTDKKLDIIYDRYRAWSNRAKFEDKLRYGRFSIISDKVDKIDIDLLVKGIKRMIVREDDYSYLYNFMKKYTSLIRFTPKQFIKISKYTDDIELLTKILQHTDIDPEVIKWCMYDVDLLKEIRAIIGDKYYIEDIVEDEPIDVYTLKRANFSSKDSNFDIVLTEEDKEDFDYYNLYMLHRDREFVMNKLDEESIVKYMYYIVRLYRFDTELIHTLILRLKGILPSTIKLGGITAYNVENKPMLLQAQKLMVHTNFRSEIDTNIILNIYEDQLVRDKRGKSIIEYICKRVNIKYIENVDFHDTYRDEYYGTLIHYLLLCENSSIYRPMVLLEALVQNKSIYNTLHKDIRTDDIDQYWRYIKMFILEYKLLRAYPLQYIGDILGVDFAMVTVK